MKKANMWEAFARYEDSAQVAALLEAEWSDLMFGADGDDRKSEFDPSEVRASPKFYQRVAALIARTSEQAEHINRSFCDIGGATGRLLYELKGHFPQANQWMLVEPSVSLCSWAKRILIQQPTTLTVPIVAGWVKAGEATVQGFASPFVAGIDTIEILNCSLQHLSRDHSGFDVLTCCNVLDRYPEPHSLVSSLLERVAPNGLLVISSPLEFDLRIPGILLQDDLKAFVSDTRWKLLSDTDEIYDIRVSTRKWVRYTSQVLILQRKEDGNASV